MTSILDHDIIARRYFFPRRDHFTAHRLAVESEGHTLVCHYHYNPADRLVLLHFHGNGEVVGDYLPAFPSFFSGKGVGTFLAEYRGYGASSGVPALVGMLDDVTALMKATQRPPSQVVVFGRSIGSIYAIEAARRFPDIAGLILESSIADPLERVLLRASPEELGVDAAHMNAEAERHLNHQQKLAAYTGPLLVLHAQDDHLVEMSHAQRNHDWAACTNKKLVLFEHGDHNSIFHANAEDYLREVYDFLDSLPA